MHLYSGECQFPGAHWPASLVKLVSSGFSERHFLKNKIGRGGVQDGVIKALAAKSDDLSLIPGICGSR